MISFLDFPSEIQNFCNVFRKIQTFKNELNIKLLLIDAKLIFQVLNFDQLADAFGF